MRVRRASMSIGLGLSLMAGVLTGVVISATPAQASWSTLPTLATAKPIGFNGAVSAASSDDTTLYLGGDFTQAGRTTGAGAFANTQEQGHQAVRAASPQFAKGTQNASVFASVYHDNYDADGFFGWFVGGDFTSVGGHPRSNFAAIDFNSGGEVGRVVAEWSPEFNGSVNALAVKPASGGRGAILYVGGEFSSVTFGGTTSSRSKIAAFDITTRTLLPWAPALSQGVSAIAVSGDRVYVGGGFSSVTPVGGVPTNRGRVAAFAADDTGTLLPWAPTVSNFNVFSLAVKDDTVFIGGDFTGVTPVGVGSTELPRSKVAAIAGDDTGTVLPWAPAFNDTVHTISVVDNVGFAGGGPALIIGGSFTRATPVDAVFSLRDRAAAVGLDDTGTLLPWAPSFNGSVLATSVSRQFHGCPNGIVKCVYVGGSFTQAGSIVGSANQARARIAAVSLDDTGTLMPWSPGVSGPTSGSSAKVWTVSAAPLHGNSDRTVFLGGEFSMAGMTSRTRLAALDSQGELTSWTPSVTGGAVRALATRGDQIYVGGTFTGATDVANTSQTRNRLAAFNAAGVLNVSWDPNVPSGNVYALAADDTRVFVGGDFISIASSGRRYLAAVSRSNGSLVTWGPTVNGTSTVSSLAIAGGKLYVGGNFPSLGQGGTQVRNKVASIQLDDTGTLTTWNPGLTGGTGTANLSIAGSRAYIAGDFTAVGGQSRPRLAAVSTEDTGSLLALNVAPGSTVNGAAYAGDRLVVGGAFTTIGGQTRKYAATIDDSGAGTANAAIDAYNDILTVVTTGGQAIVAGDYVASLGGVAIGNIAYGPRAPTDVTASAFQSGIPLDGELSLSWTAPWSGTFPIQGYRIEMSSDGGSTWSTLIANTGDTNTTRAITGLTNGTSYSFKITTLSVLGTNTSVASAPVAPVADTAAIRGSQTQLSSPAGLLRDSTGRLYAANTGGTAVTVYASGAVGDVAPVARLVRTAGISGAPVGLSWGASGSVWVSYTSCHLARFPALAPSASGNITADWVIEAGSSGSQSCKGLAASPVSGELSFVRGTNDINSIVTVASTAGGPNGDPVAWSDNVSALRTVTGLTWSYLLSANATGDLLVGDETTALKMPRTANGVLGAGASPLQSVTNMYWARQVFERSDGSLVVVEENGAGQPVLDVFAPEATGAATPLAVVNGSATLSTTGLRGVALSADELTAYVTSSSNAITWISGLPALQSPPTPPTPTPTPTPTPGDPPSTPREVSAVAGDAAATVAWAAPSSPGSFPVSSYQVTARPGGRGCMTTALTCTVSNLVNGTTYTFTVKALNGAGWSAASAPSDPVTPQATPQPAITIMITGTRSARTIEITGSTRGIEPGSQVTPWIRKPAAQAQAGRPQRVDDDGGFTWSRRVRSDGIVRAYVTWGDIRSNVVRLPAGR